MRYTDIMGQVTKASANFLKNIGFKNISNFNVGYDCININTKNGLTAEIKFNSPGVRGVYWSVEDFRGQAEQRWEIHLDDYPAATCWQDVYDENKFQEALNRMVDKHDAEIGITWDTFNFWLDELCLK